jgi:hypothetical protein
MKRLGWLGLCLCAGFIFLACSDGGDDDGDNNNGGVTAGAGVWVANKGDGTVNKYAFDGSVKGIVHGFQ